MKTRSQKLISLVLVLMMLVTMIPAGFFGANAAVSEELAAGLADYDNTAEFVINSVEDWEAIAASGKTFSGKTVKLGDNIDAKGATLTPLAPLAVDNSGIILDGQGFAIMNVGTADAPQTRPLVSEKFSGGTVKNVTFQNVIMVGADATYGSGLIANWLNGWGTATVQNVKVLGCSITDTVGCAGALFGRTINNNEDASVVIDGVVIDAATNVTAPAGHAGGIIGHISGNGGTYNISRVYTEANVKTDTPASKYVGGLIGYAQDSIKDKTVTPNVYFPFHFNISDCVVKGTITSEGATGWTGRLGGIFGRGTDLLDLNLADMIVAPSAFTGGVVLGQAICAANGAQDLSVTNCYYTQKFTSLYYAENSTSTLDGAAMTSGHHYSLAGMTKLDATAVDNYYETDADGFITEAGKLSEMIVALNNYDTTETFTIKSVKDWNLIATSGKGFLGKTILLGNDIDAKGGELKTLIPASRAANSFWAHFDGQGYTIKNATVANALFAHTLMKGATGGVNGAAEIKNVNLDNITVTGTDAAFIAVQYSPYQEDAAITIDGIKITNSSVTATGVAGGMYATNTHHNSAGQDGAIIKNVYMSETVTITGGTAAGGLIGQTYWNSGWLTISNIETYATVATTSVGDNYYVGGLIGNGAHLYTSGTGVTVTNCIIGGTLRDASNTNSGGGVGAVFGYVACGGTKVYNMKNLILMANYESADRFKTLLGVFSGAPVLTVSGILSVYGYGSNPWPYVGSSGTLTINGIAKAGGEMSSIDRGAIQIVKIDPANIENLVKRDDNGFIIKVYDGVAPKAIQYSQVDAETNTYAIRFIAMSQLTTVTNLKMTVIATYKDAEGNTVRKKFEKACDLYDALSVYSAQGIGERRTAEEYGAEKLAGLTIYNIPADTEITFEVTTSYDYYTGALTGVDGTTTLTETSSNPQIITASVVDGELVIKD